MTVLKKYQYYFVLFMVLIILIGGYLLFSDEEEELVVDTLFLEEVSPTIEINDEWIMVDVKGAVKNEGVYQIERGKRIIDCIELAGGLLEEADKYQVNLAQLVEDEMVVYIPFRENATIVNIPSIDDGKININIADYNELQKLPGIGAVKATAIVEYRENVSKFKSIEDIKNVNGIGEKNFEKIKEKIKIK